MILAFANAYALLLGLHEETRILCQNPTWTCAGVWSSCAQNAYLPFRVFPTKERTATVIYNNQVVPKKDSP